LSCENSSNCLTWTQRSIKETGALVRNPGRLQCQGASNNHNVISDWSIEVCMGIQGEGGKKKKEKNFFFFSISNKRQKDPGFERDEGQQREGKESREGRVIDVQAGSCVDGPNNTLERQPNQRDNINVPLFTSQVNGGRIRLSKSILRMLYFGSLRNVLLLFYRDCFCANR
jgi:hypothetical protein